MLYCLKSQNVQMQVIQRVQVTTVPVVYNSTNFFFSSSRRSQTFDSFFASTLIIFFINSSKNIGFSKILKITIKMRMKISTRIKNDRHIEEHPFMIFHVLSFHADNVISCIESIFTCHVCLTIYTVFLLLDYFVVCLMCQLA